MNRRVAVPGMVNPGVPEKTRPGRLFDNTRAQVGVPVAEIGKWGSPPDVTQLPFCYMAQDKTLALAIHRLSP